VAPINNLLRRMTTVYLLLKVKYVLAAVCEGCQEADPVLQILLNKKRKLYSLTGTQMQGLFRFL
jgi:hypothetical protein